MFNAMKYTIDATNQKLGRLASHIAVILQGKNSPFYERRLAGKDQVIVENVDKIVLTGKKPLQKVYRHHTGYPGHLKEVKFSEVMKRNPAKVLRLAVSRMLPKNRLRKQRMKNLIIK